LLCWGSLGVAGLLLLVFLLDLILGVPLGMGEFGDRAMVELSWRSGLLPRRHTWPGNRFTRIR